MFPVGSGILLSPCAHFEDAAWRLGVSNSVHSLRRHASRNQVGSRKLQRKAVMYSTLGSQRGETAPFTPTPDLSISGSDELPILEVVAMKPRALVRRNGILVKGSFIHR